MSPLGLILVIILIIALLGGFSGRFRGYGHGGISVRRRPASHGTDLGGPRTG